MRQWEVWMKKTMYKTMKMQAEVHHQSSIVSFGCIRMGKFMVLIHIELRILLALNLYIRVTENICLYIYIMLKHMKKICSVFQGLLIFINFPPSKWEGYYACSSIVGGFLHP
jgi:hypothetical protein